MNRIVLFSALICGVFVGNECFADADSCKMNSSKTCAFVNAGGGYEQNKCIANVYKANTIINAKNGINNYEGTNDQCTINENRFWKSKNTACEPENSPAGHCIEQRKTYTNHYCVLNSINRSRGETCSCGASNTTLASIQTITSCAAKYCNDGYLLYTTNTRQERKVVDAKIASLKDEMLKKKVGSQGLCRSRESLKSVCEKSCVCGKNEKCVLNEITIENYNRKVPAFIGEEMCVCVSDNNNGDNGGDNETLPDVENCEECVYTLQVDVKCANGKTFKKDEQIKLTKDEVEKIRWTEAKSKLDTATSGAVIDNLLKEISGYETLIEKICKKDNVIVNPTVTPTTPQGPSAAEIKSATDKLSAFSLSAESNRNVWKDAEGKFNTARLASDLTAGVVLGTVGGVVSGVVIKKKQVQKGFEALHCTVGGQTIADWGDDFSVGLR